MHSSHFKKILDLIRECSSRPLSSNVSTNEISWPFSFVVGRCHSLSISYDPNHIFPLVNTNQCFHTGSSVNGTRDLSLGWLRQSSSSVNSVIFKFKVSRGHEIKFSMKLTTPALIAVLYCGVNLSQCILRFLSWYCATSPPSSLTEGAIRASTYGRTSYCAFSYNHLRQQFFILCQTVRDCQIVYWTANRVHSIF